MGEHELLRLLDDARDIIFHYRVRPQPGFVYVSGACTSITGYTPEEHYANPKLLATMIDPRDRERLKQITAGHAHCDGTPYVLRWVRKDGRTIWTEQRLFVTRGADGRPDSFQGIVREATARIEADAQLRAELQELHKRLLPVCSHCKRVRDDDGRWMQLDVYVTARWNVPITHGICADCLSRHFPE